MEVDHLVLVGLNHRALDIARRERAAVGPPELRACLLQLRRLIENSELLLLSTCSRLEIAAITPNPTRAQMAITLWLSQRLAGESPALYYRQGTQAISHLIRVAAGLESWIIGESEIQEQLREAYRHAVALGAGGKTLSQTIQRVLLAAKSVRARTNIQGGIHSIGGAAVLLARRIFPGPEPRSILVMGAGRASESVLRNLSARNFQDICISSRRPEHARELARKVGGEALSSHEAMAALSRVDAAIFSTSRAGLLDASELRARIAGRRETLYLLDLGLPRNVAPECARLDGVHLYDLDDLRSIVRRNMDDKALERRKAESLARAEAASASRWLSVHEPAGRR
ncbi:MAG: glutamyl-tRNA reductase [Elusimicrobia bacterium]|nr:glutamyl-tRNA reductase [Elusimicrobiota bacterium]